MKAKWLQTLALSGLSTGAAQFVTAASAGHHPGLAGTGVALAVTAASVIGGYLTNRANSLRDAQLSEAERKALAERNHHLRRGMAEALRRGLNAARLNLGSLPADPYDALFASWEQLLSQAKTDEDALERLFPAAFAESQWQATNTYSPSPDDDAGALAGLLREWLIVDSRIYGQWDKDQALAFARQVLPYYQQAFADDLAADSKGLLFRAFAVKGVNQIRFLADQALVELRKLGSENRELHHRTYDMQVEARDALGRIEAALTPGARIGSDAYQALYEVDLRQHWKPRAMGSGAIFQGGLWYFSGRTAALRQILTWLAQPTSKGRACVVTGDPGSGKSALLGYIVTATDRKEVQQPTLVQFLAGMPDGTRPAAGCVDFAINLREKKLDSVLAALADRFQGAPDEVVQLIANRRERTVLVFDALDEASESGKIATLLLRPLTGYEHLWVLIGSRRPEIPLLGGSIELLDLDTNTYQSDDDIEIYAERLLSARGETRLSPYKENRTAAREAAQAVARAAGGNFLVAHVLTQDLVERQTILDLEWELPRRARDAFAHYLTSLSERLRWEEQRLLRTLRPLAYAEGQGLPRESWKQLLSGDIHEDIEVVLKRGSAFVGRYDDGDHIVHRFYHEALAEALRDPEVDRVRSAEVSRALIAGVPGGNWLRADWYTRKYLPAHVVKAGLLEEVDRLLLDTRFLAVADTEQLLAVLHVAISPEAQRRGNWFRLCADRFASSRPGERLSCLELVAKQNGAGDLARSTEIGDMPRPWRARWARGSATFPHLVLQGHTDSVEAVAISDGVIASASWDATVRLWDRKTGQPIHEPLLGEPSQIGAVAISTTLVVAGGADKTVRLWDRGTGQSLGEPLLGHDGPVSSVAVNGDLVASGSWDGTVQLWSLRTRKPICEPLRGHNGRVCAVAISDHVIVSGGDDGSVRLWDRDSGLSLAEPLCGHKGPVLSVAISGNVVVSGSEDATVRLWDRITGSLIRKPLRGHQGHVTGVAIDGDVVVSGGQDGTVRLWDSKTGRLICNLLSQGIVHAVAINKEAVVSAEYKRVRVWDRKNCRPIGEPNGAHNSEVTAVATGEGAVVTGGEDESVRFWDPDTGKPIGKPIQCDVPVVSVAANGDVIAAGTRRSVMLWDRDTHRRIRKPFDADQLETGTVALHKHLLVSGDYHNIRVWDWTTGQRIPGYFRGHEAEVTAVSISSDVVVSGAYDGSLRVWDRKIKATIEAPGMRHEHQVTALAINGELIASGSYDFTVRLWNRLSCRQLGDSFRHDNEVSAVAIGKGFVVSGSWDTTVRVWNIKTGRAVFCIHLGSHVNGVSIDDSSIFAACDNCLVRIDVDLPLSLWE